MAERINAAPYRGAHRLSVAPMIEWTDRHCRYFHRAISGRALLYTEMIAGAAVIHGPRARLLDYSSAEHPLALQLGGSEPSVLAEAVRIASDWGYDEINLNVGCPSDRVQSGCFGAVLMRSPEVVAACVEAMRGASEAVGGPPITVKCRIGVDDDEPSERLPEFIDTVAQAGCETFIIHARKAWLQGLSPKENRTIPPLDYDLALAMKARWPALTIVLNGGIESLAQARAQIARGFDGVMIGRAAYNDPIAILGEADAQVFGQGQVFGEAQAPVDPFAVLEQMLPYIEARMREGVRLHSITRHMLGLFAGRPGARLYRRHLSEHAHKDGATPALLLEAAALVGERV
ncbi:MAG: tRNA dihydrouridine(20/20a) synthase DusA [Neomegalonema sp.]|nr:tRNA dihydrouridine(20/20a) synthase DusA [Neomegalonema sp.]